MQSLPPPCRRGPSTGGSRARGVDIEVMALTERGECVDLARELATWREDLFSAPSRARSSRTSPAVEEILDRQYPERRHV
jgi:hypothetical protein